MVREVEGRDGRDEVERDRERGKEGRREEQGRKSNVGRKREE